LCRRLYLSAELKAALTYLLLAVALVIVGFTVYFVGIVQLSIVPKWLLYLSLAYIGLQLYRVRVLKVSSKTSDLLYYVGLIVMVIPVFLNNPDQILPYRWIFVILVSSLLIPALQDVINLQKNEQT
jgi:FtsH-binding integral membrane protein